MIDKTCEDFLKGHSDSWSQMQSLLETDFKQFTTKYLDGKWDDKHIIKQVTFKNKYGVDQAETDWFEFQYLIGHRLHSNEPRCLNGDNLEVETPTCKLWCKDAQCHLRNPPTPHSDESHTNGNSKRSTFKGTASGDLLAGEDLDPAEWGENSKISTDPTGFDDSTSDLEVPSKDLNPQRYVVPHQLLNHFLQNVGALKAPEPHWRRMRLIEQEVKEGVPQPVNLASTF